MLRIIISILDIPAPFEGLLEPTCSVGGGSVFIPSPQIYGFEYLLNFMDKITM